jgi:hypothetical protein
MSTYEALSMFNGAVFFTDLWSLVSDPFFTNLHDLSSSANIAVSQFFLTHTHAKLSRLPEPRTTPRR